MVRRLLDSKRPSLPMIATCSSMPSVVRALSFQVSKLKWARSRL